jgi:hypothetical protein
MSGLCRTSCATTSDCAPDFSCNPANQRCEAVRSPETADDSGCGCRTAPGRADQRRRREVPGGGLGLLMLGIALTALRRRRALRGPAFPAGRHR